ncbi:Hsp70 interacting protein HIP [Besnoitia besnoiti]|uniref:Hsp70 interacting protein HIP n=1 Tax=Besnoitia besnoiti TaxID=94643 RepID=A0A2A9MKR8_BESBE|nr:Hsp70 interacting protein HIP [Besnoitia besnoiti]PFH38549.1 Hsp70 interacting protein HIP [Besnoitia besnoiti]
MWFPAVCQLKAFIGLCQRDPSILHRPELSFFKDYLQSLNADIPAERPAEAQSRESAGSDVLTPEESPDEESSDSEAEELDEESLKDSEVIPPETTTPPPLAPEGDRELTDDELEKLAKLKEEASSACEIGDLETALAKYTEALQVGSPTALLYTRRADTLLKLRRPVACIRDCDEALKLNPDNARAYKIRGKANRLLGKWREAHSDLDMGQKLDYDEALWDMQKLVDEKYKKIEEHERKILRKREEKERKRREKEARKRRAAAQRAYEEQKKREAAASGGFPGGFPEGFPGYGGAAGFPGGASGFNFPGGMSGGFTGTGCGGPGMGGSPGGCCGGADGGCGGGMPAGSMPGGAGNLFGALNDPELKKLFENPKMMAAFQEIMSNPSSISKYASDPEVMAAVGNLTSKFGGGIPGAGFPAGSPM